MYKHHDCLPPRYGPNQSSTCKVEERAGGGVLPTASEQLDDGHDDRSGEAGAGEHPSQPFSDDDIRTRLLIRFGGRENDK